MATSDSLQRLRVLRVDAESERNPDNNKRRELHREAQKLVLALETDGDVLTRTQWGLWETVCVAIAIDTGLFEVLAADKVALPADNLAKSCHMEPLLMQRVLRCLDAYGAVDSTMLDGQPRYTANRVSRLYTTDRGTSHARWMLGILAPGWPRVPDKLKANNYRSLTAGTNTVYNDIRGKPESDFWGILTPEEIQLGNIFMPTFNAEQQNFLDVYPAEERLIRGADSSSDSVLFIDVGGNTGSQAATFRRRFPQAPGRVIVQDLERVLNNTEPGIEPMVQDFFAPQKIQGARAYYLRMIMHDWGHDNNVKILTHLREAMKPGYSKLLINDWIMPDEGASRLMTSMDLCMMTVFGGEERPEYRHREYIEAAGLKVTGIWDTKDGISYAVIECEPA